MAEENKILDTDGSTKMEAVLSTKRIDYRMPRLIIDGSEIQLKNQLTYSGVELDSQL